MATPPQPADASHLPELLLARIAEIEVDAHDAAAARGPDWAVEEPPPPAWIADSRDPVILARGKPIANITDYNPLAADHIARHDPAHVLAWCTALRTIIELHRHDHACPDTTGMDDYTWANAPRNANCATLLALAQLLTPPSLSVSEPAEPPLTC